MDQSPPLPKMIAWFAPWTWKRRWLCPAAMAFMLVVYPLSIGLAWALAQRNWLPDQVVLAVYTPLFWVADQHPILWKTLNDYIFLIAPGCL